MGQSLSGILPISVWPASSLCSTATTSAVMRSCRGCPQRGFFPELPPADAAAMTKYAGQLMTTGAQAQTYADHFIAVHLRKIGGGKTYSQLSAESLANPSNAALKAQVDTLFKGETLRGLLLNAYAFWQMGQIALIAGIVSLAAAAVMLVLSVLGFVHLRRTPAEAELLPAGQRA